MNFDEWWQTEPCKHFPSSTRHACKNAWSASAAERDLVHTKLVNACEKLRLSTMICGYDDEEESIIAEFNTALAAVKEAI